jgi:hypothetical protein
MRLRFPELCPSKVSHFTEQHAPHFRVEARSIRQALHAAGTHQLFEPEHDDRDQALLQNLSTYPVSKWLETLQVMPFLLLDDRYLQDKACIRVRVCNFTAMT